MGTFLCILFLVIGIIIRPWITKFLKKPFLHFFEPVVKRYEIEFKIEFYSQPSIHHLGETGILVKTDPIKIQIDAENQDEALDLIDSVIKQEVKAELLAIKEIAKL